MIERKGSGAVVNIKILRRAGGQFGEGQPTFRPARGVIALHQERGDSRWRATRHRQPTSRTGTEDRHAWPKRWRTRCGKIPHKDPMGTARQAGGHRASRRVTLRRRGLHHRMSSRHTNVIRRVYRSTGRSGAAPGQQWITIRLKLVRDRASDAGMDALGEADAAPHGRTEYQRVQEFIFKPTLANRGVPQGSARTMGGVRGNLNHASREEVLQISQRITHIEMALEDDLCPPDSISCGARRGAGRGGGEARRSWSPSRDVPTRPVQSPRRCRAMAETESSPGVIEKLSTMFDNWSKSPPDQRRPSRRRPSRDLEAETRRRLPVHAVKPERRHRSFADGSRP